MNYMSFRKLVLVCSAGFLWAGLSAQAAPNNWTNSLSALWRSSTNWSLAVVPNSDSAVDPTQITNAVTKTVTIDSATAATNLLVLGLTVSAPAGATNTLALVNVPLGTPFSTSQAFLVGNRGELAITNSAVAANLDFDIANGSLILDSGSLTCGLNCDLQAGGITVNSGTLTATAGTTGIRMGRFSGANTFLTLNGGTVTTRRVTLGSVTATTNTLTLAGGNLICNDSLSLGQIQNTTANATMTAGNLFVTNGITKIADRAAATFSQSGGNCYFADLRIGDLGVGTYNLSGGQLATTARTPNDLCIIGNLENGVFNQSGGLAVIRNELHVADFPDVTAAINLTGGQFIATNARVSIGRLGIGTMTISNSLVQFTNTSIGRHPGSSGTLTLQSNGNLFLIADLSIGRLTNATGHVLVNGGLLSVINNDLWVGRHGTGDLNVSSGMVRARALLVGRSDDPTNTPAGAVTLTGGTTLVTSNLVVGTSLISTGQVAVAGGTLAVTNAGGTANLIVAQGTFAIDSGAVTADRVFLTNTAGQFTFNGGLLRTKTMTVSNGTPFTVGDGVNPATLELQGGVYSFADGLVISPNATVTGCGTVIGTIVNHGTYTNSCGGAPPPPTTISAVGKTASTVTISCPSQNGWSYTLEYKNSLTDPVWTPILPATPGTGSSLILTDSSATNASRFYRVRVQ